MVSHTDGAVDAGAWITADTGFAPLWLLAQGSDPSSALISGGTQGATTGAPAGTPGGPPTGATQPQGFPIGMMVLLGGFMILVMVMSGSQQRKAKKRHAEMMASLRKNDRVITIGGMIGTVVDVRDNEVILKVDENSNSRVRFTRSAIQEVLKSSDTGPAAAEPKIEVKAGKSERTTV